MRWLFLLAAGCGAAAASDAPEASRAPEAIPVNPSSEVVSIGVQEPAGAAAHISSKRGLVVESDDAILLATGGLGRLYVNFAGLTPYGDLACALGAENDRFVSVYARDIHGRLVAGSDDEALEVGPDGAARAMPRRPAKYISVVDSTGTVLEVPAFLAR